MFIASAPDFFDIVLLIIDMLRNNLINIHYLYNTCTINTGGNAKLIAS